MSASPPSDPVDTPAWLRLDPLTTTSGQPSEEQLVRIAALGVTHVVNLGLHSHEKALPDEAASVGALGMRYIHIPVAFDAPAETDFAAFREVMAALEGRPVHVHCIANMRVSAFIYRWRLEQGWDEPEARAAMETVWRPGEVWAAFIGDEDAIGRKTQVAGMHY